MTTRLLERDLVTLTVAQYHRMVEAGILPEGEPIELIDGLLVKKNRGAGMTAHPLHALVVSRLIRLAPSLEALGYHLRLQNPITIAPPHEPEPDAAIVRGTPAAYMLDLTEGKRLAIAAVQCLPPSS
ncbi:MAG: hypothetical protein U1F68_14175 [Gammaproteobacteria bacterium]